MLKVGDIIWRFDINRRVYRKPGALGGGGPIYSEHFSSGEIVGETSQSWLVGRSYKPHKVNKKTMREANGRFLGDQWFTADGMAENIWIHENRPAISSRLSVENDVSKLKRIKAILDEGDA